MHRIDSTLSAVWTGISAVPHSTLPIQLRQPSPWAPWLEWTSGLPASAVNVLVEQGRVTLSGQVGWQVQRQAASDRVPHLMGVLRLGNEISLEPSISMTAVKADIEAALKRTAIDDARNISVEVRGTDVTLGGTVGGTRDGHGRCLEDIWRQERLDNLQMVW